MRNSILSLCSAVILFVIGALIINWQLWHLATINTSATAENAAKGIEAMLDEASGATTTAEHVATEGCTSRGQLDLGTEAALRPHLRAIMIMENDQVMCTSLPGNGVLIKNLATLPYSRLALLSGAMLYNNFPVLVLQTPTPGGRVIVSISDAHLRDALPAATNELNLALVVGDKMLQHAGDVSTLNTDAATLAQRVSPHYPFTIEYQPAHFFNLTRLLQQGWGLLLMILFLSCAVGILMRRYLGKNTSFEDDLRKAIMKGEIVPFYQPVVNGLTGAICGVEVLARWKHPESGLIPPNVFIPIAEKSGLIIPLTQNLMTQVVKQMKPLLPKLPDEFNIGINVSAGHINSASFNGDCHIFQKGFEGKSVKLVLEVTEREPLTENPHLVENLNKLHSEGFVIALDDFGTGYSGLSCLNELAIDYIKIDKSFVSRVSDQKDSTILLDCVIELARKMSLNIVAEGVETKEQLEYLNRNKITLLQGYYFGRPVSYVEFIKVLLSRPRGDIRINTGESVAAEQPDVLAERNV